MWLNKYEEAKFGPFAKCVYENENSDFAFEYSDGTKIMVNLYLYEYESDNGLDLSDPKYEEYWEMAFVVKEIIKDDANIYVPGDKILVNYRNIPDSYKVVK